ncbi:MAG: terminase family protein [Armatimonadota bacterium]|nr:terminase family protein [bacterium]
MNNASLRLRLARMIWGWKPHETQKQWMLSDASLRIAACGRRWGKTESAAIDAATMAILEPGSVQMIVSPTYDQSRLIFDRVERLLTDSPVTRPVTKVSRTHYPRLSVGRSVIVARTADEDGHNLRGNSADRVIIDEAAFVRDSVVQEVISPMLADRDGKLVMISTPFGKNHFYRAFMRGAQSCEDILRVSPSDSHKGLCAPEPALGSECQGNLVSLQSQETESLVGFGATPQNNARRTELLRSCESFTFPSWANPHISREYIERQRSEISPRQFAVEYEARFVDDQSCVFAWDEINGACERHSHDGMSSFDCVAAGIDWARYSDYTAIVAVGVSESGCEVVGIDRFNAMGWSSQIKRVTDFLARYKVNCVLTDQTSIGDPLLEQLMSKLWADGVDIAVEGYNFTNQSKRDLIENLSLKFAHGMISIPRDEALMRELQYFEYELTQSGNVRMNARPGCHDDLVIALALACRQANDAGTADRFLGRNGRLSMKGW